MPNAANADTQAARALGRPHHRRQRQRADRGALPLRQRPRPKGQAARRRPDQKGPRRLLPEEARYPAAAAAAASQACTCRPRAAEEGRLSRCRARGCAAWALNGDPLMASDAGVLSFPYERRVDDERRRRLYTHCDPSQ